MGSVLDGSEIVRPGDGEDEREVRAVAVAAELEAINGGEIAEFKNRAESVYGADKFKGWEWGVLSPITDTEKRRYNGRVMRMAFTQPGQDDEVTEVWAPFLKETRSGNSVIVMPNGAIYSAVPNMGSGPREWYIDTACEPVPPENKQFEMFKGAESLGGDSHAISVGDSEEGLEMPGGGRVLLEEWVINGGAEKRDMVSITTVKEGLRKTLDQTHRLVNGQEINR
jgi:hypothetical protein